MNSYIYPIVSSWNDFKSSVSVRKMNPQWYEYDPGDGINNSYKIYACDCFFMFEWTLEKNGNNDVVDFENNYKDIWNQRLEYRTSEGIIRQTASPRPDGTRTVFMGSGDSSGYGLGNRLIFNMTASDSSKYIDNCFDEDVYIKDGIIITKDAPFGSYIDFHMYDPQDNLSAKYCEKINLLGTQRIDLNSEDTALFPQGFKLKATVFNSDGTGGQDNASSFQVVANLEMYRSSML